MVASGWLFAADMPAVDLHYPSGLTSLDLAAQQFHTKLMGRKESLRSGLNVVTHNTVRAPSEEGTGRLRAHSLDIVIHTTPCEGLKGLQVGQPQLTSVPARPGHQGHEALLCMLFIWQ